MISAIIVNYNTRELLLSCIRSLSPYVSKVGGETIVVDNNSNDGSVNSVRSNFPDVQIISNQCNYGYAKAVNQGILASTQSYVLVANSDTIVVGNALELLLRFMEDNPKAGMAGPMLLRSDLSKEFSCKRRPTIRWELVNALMLQSLLPKVRLFNREIDSFIPCNAQSKVDEIAGAFMLVRRRAIDEVGLLDEDFFLYGEDQDWCKRFRDLGWGIYHIPAAKVIHVGGASSRLERARCYGEYEKAHMIYWLKHGSMREIYTVSCLRLLYHLIRIAAKLIKVLIGQDRENEARKKIMLNITCLRFQSSFFSYLLARTNIGIDMKGASNFIRCWSIT